MCVVLGPKESSRYSPGQKTALIETALFLSVTEDQIYIELNKNGFKRIFFFYGGGLPAIKLSFRKPIHSLNEKNALKVNSCIK